MGVILVDFNESPSPDRPYKLILATNRDEYYGRPAQPAHYWQEHPTIVGGRDLHPGREGGTWCAMSKSGKIGVVSQVAGNPGLAVPSHPSRGNIVNEYLIGGSSCQEYADRLQGGGGDRYNRFSVLLAECRNNNAFELISYNNISNELTRLKPGSHVLGERTHHEQPFVKHIHAKTLFCELIKRAGGGGGGKKQLIAELIRLLKSTKRHYPDAVLRAQAPKLHDIILDEASSLCYDLAHMQFGTRCHTVILVDGDNHVTFVEHSRMTPASRTIFHRTANLIATTNGNPDIPNGHSAHTNGVNSDVQWFKSQFEFDLSQPQQ